MSVRAQVPWTGTWAAPANEVSIEEPALPPGLQKLTLRQVVPVSLGGDAVRLHFTNAHGTQPVTIADVRVAAADSDKSTLPGTDRLVTFDGSHEVTIPAGRTVASDPVAFSLNPCSDLAVSVYFPRPVDAARMSGHTQAWQYVYLANGDVSAQAKIDAIELTKPLTSFYYLTGIDVRNRQALGAVATFGASITDDSNTTFGAHRGWRDLLAQRFCDAHIPVGVVNASLSGNRLLSSSRFGGATGVSRFEQDALEQGNVKWLIFSDDPINDLSGAKPPAYDALLGAIKRLRDEAHARGVKFYCSTLTPNVGRAAEAWTPEAEATLERINAFYRGAESGCDGIVDQDSVTHDPAMPKRYLPAYDAGDHLHPNDAGHKKIAESIDLSWFDGRK
jgi:lysophospholipase L1-like esterase